MWHHLPVIYFINDKWIEWKCFVTLGVPLHNTTHIMSILLLIHMMKSNSYSGINMALWACVSVTTNRFYVSHNDKTVNATTIYNEFYAQIKSLCMQPANNREGFFFSFLIKIHVIAIELLIYQANNKILNKLDHKSTNELNDKFYF